MPKYPDLNVIPQNMKQVLYEQSYSDYRIEYKYGYLKQLKTPNEYQKLLDISQTKPVLINSLKDYKKYKINAKCQHQYYQNALSNLKMLSLKNCKVQEYDQLILVILDFRYVYRSVQKEWRIVEKLRLFERQYDILSKLKYFRVDMSKIFQYQSSKQDLKDFIIHQDMYIQLIRYKQVQKYFITPNQTIQIASVYEQGDIQQNFFKNIVLKSEQIVSDIINAIKSSTKKINCQKLQLSLIFTSKGIEKLAKCSNQEAKQIFSKSFDFFTNLSVKFQNSQSDISELMSLLQ